jgi:hypothetical protein
MNARRFSIVSGEFCMAAKSRSRRKAITLIQVGWVAFFFAIAGGIYGLFTGGPVNMIILFVACFVGGFILSYVGASFIELLRK